MSSLDLTGVPSLRFGTSGLRGLASELDGFPAFAYSLAFIETLKRDGSVSQSRDRVLVARDLRQSSPSIASWCCAAVRQAGLTPIDCGPLPTPALAYLGMQLDLPGIMVTGSHIPEDRNGLKFYRAQGEIGKRDEEAILEALGRIQVDRKTVGGISGAIPDVDPVALYRRRYLEFFGPRALAGLNIGVYQHSSVARDLLLEIIESLGAQAIPLGRADRFVPVDTEALRDEDRMLARMWANQHPLHAIVSTDGDADRPLLADENGDFLRGDLIGAITARYLEADAVVTPVTSNSALEASGVFERVVRTRVGSPYVIEGMAKAADAGARTIVGFEANGGVLLGSPVTRHGRNLTPLPTRDALLPILSTLSVLGAGAQSLAELGNTFAFKAAASDRLKNVEVEKTKRFLDRLTQDQLFLEDFFAPLGGVAHIDDRDGLRFSLQNGEIVHFRASGNAPELRSYVEASSEQLAQRLLQWSLEMARQNTV